MAQVNISRAYPKPTLRVFVTFGMRRWIVILFAFLSFELLAQSPAELPGLELWVRGDSALGVLNEHLTNWGDLSGNGRDLSQGNPGFMPPILEDTLAGHTVIGFNGTTHRLVFDEVDNVRTLFMVFRETEGASGFRVVMGHSELYPFFRGPGNTLWHSVFTNAEVLDGTTRMNFTEVDGAETTIPQGQYQILSLVTTGNVPADQFAQDRGNPQLFSGELAELIITSEPLDSADVADMEQYLADYYSAQLDLGPDIQITDNLCDTTLTANAGFASYLWSTGHTGPQLVVQQEGQYWVQVLDDFGRLQTDTVSVTYPGNLTPPGLLNVCLNDSLLWDTDLSEEEYTFEWSNGSVQPFAYYSDPGAHSVTVTDAQGCSQTSEEWALQVDSFAAVADLGPDTQLCAGNLLELEADGYNVQSYLWQDELTDPTFTIESSGQYWLEATNENGCTLHDTISVVVTGLAPNVEILSPPFICELAENTLQASASSEDSVIDSYLWLLNDQPVSNASSFVWTPETTGSYTLTLTVGTAAGCDAQTTLNLTVNPQPQGNIVVEGQCAGDEITFSTFPMIESGAVTNVEWLFAAEAADGESVSFTPQESGFQQVQLLLTSDAGCSNQFDQLINVLPTPVVSFTAPNTCEGELMTFASQVDENGAGTIVDYSWFFGDGGASGQANPAHFYSNPGNYQVSFGATGMNGCTGWFTGQAIVIDEPMAEVLLSNACAGLPFVLQSVVTSTDPAVEYLWTVEGAEGGSEFNGETVEVTFSETGFQAWELTVLTENGCIAETSGQLPVFAPPVAAFSFTPEIGSPPLEVAFINESQDAAITTWDFGDGFASGAFAPNHTYEEEGSYLISLAIENVYGCPDTAVRTIEVTEPVLDVIAQQLFVSEEDGRLAFTLQAVNQSNFTLQTVDFKLQIGNGSSFAERSEQAWQPGQVRTFTWEVRLEPRPEEYPWVCAEVAAVTSVTSEITPQDNRTCAEMDALNFFAPPFPNPVVQGQEVQLRFNLQTREDVHLQIIDGAGRIAIETEPQLREAGFQTVRLATDRLRPGHYRVILFTNGERAAASALQVR